MQVNQPLDVVVPPACTFIKNQIPTYVLYCEFAECFSLQLYQKLDSHTNIFCKFSKYFQTGTFSKTGLRHRRFLVTFEKFFSQQRY